MTVVYLIPNDFRGRITIASSQPCGQHREQNDKIITYRIPRDGVLIVQEELVTAAHFVEYYFVDAKGDRVKRIFNDGAVDSENDSDASKEKKVVISFGSNSGLASGQSDNKNFMETESFHVVREDSANIELPDDAEYVNSLLRECKKKAHKEQ